MYYPLSRLNYIVPLVAGTALLLLCSWSNANSKDLGDILKQVEKHTTALQAAHARTEQQQAATRKAKSRYFGEIDVLGKNSNYDSARLTNPISFPVNLQPELFDDNQIGYGLTGRLSLDINGRIKAGVTAAIKQLDAALARQGDVRLRILHGTADLYHSLEGIKALEDAMAKQIEALTAHIKVATSSIEAGRAAPVEKLRLVADQEAVKGKLATLKGQEQEIRARLAALMASESFPDTVIPIHNPPQNSTKTTCDTKSRPDIQALLSRGEAADAEVKAASAMRFPELNLNGSWMQNQGFNGDGDDTWSLFVQLQLPIWDGGARRATIAGAEAGRTVVRYELKTLEYQARAEFVAAQSDWQAAEISYKATIASVEAARETARIQTDRFIEGRLSAADLVDAEASLASARSNRALSLTQWWQAEDHLRLAVGLEPSAYQQTPEKP